MYIKIEPVITRAVIEGVASGFSNLVELRRENKTEDPTQQEVVSFIALHVLEALSEVVDFQEEPVKIKDINGEEAEPVIEGRPDECGETS